jgi:hypothetical protein
MGMQATIAILDQKSRDVVLLVSDDDDEEEEEDESDG